MLSLLRVGESGWIFVTDMYLADEKMSHFVANLLLARRAKGEHDIGGNHRTVVKADTANCIQSVRCVKCGKCMKVIYNLIMSLLQI